MDDDREYLAYLVKEMGRDGAHVVGVESGQEAVRLVQANPQGFQFAVIDHWLPGGMDGIDTTRQLFLLNRGIFILVFTNVPSDDGEAIARFRYDALSAGAFRYLERGSAEEGPRQIQDFVCEMEQLIRLRDWIRDHYETRASVLPSLLTQLDIGVDIIDRSYKVWYMNRAMRRITGVGGESLPRRPYSVRHDYESVPCPGFVLQDAFADCAAHDRLFLSPLLFRERDRLFFMQVWTQPLRHERGNLLLDSDGLPLAVMESVRDLTGSARLREMPLEQRLRIIAGALCECPVRGRYIPCRCFERARVFIHDYYSPDRFVLQAASGFSPPLQLQSPVYLRATEHMRSAESNMRQSGYGYYFREAGGADPLSPGTPRERFIYWPVIQGERTVALLEVSGDNCGVDMVPLLRPYADEVSAAIRDAAAQMGPISASIESDMAGIDLRLQTVGSPEEALKVLVSECCRLTNSLTGVVRYRDEDDAVILRLEIPDYSSYERVAAPRHSLSHPWSWSARTIVSGQENIVDIAHHREIIMKSRKRLSEQQREAVKDVGSMCFQPLLLDGRCIGSLGLHARAPVNYTEEKVRIARLVARRAALALHDYLVAQETARQVEDAQAETVRLILHNIHNPLATIRTELDRLAKEVSRSELDREALAGQVAMLTRQAERIARVREEYLRLQKPWESRIEPADIHELLRTATNEWTAGHGEVTVSYDLASHLRNVRIDCSAIEVCLGVLIQNSLDALQSGNLAKAITIRLRSPTKEEVALLGGPGPGLAVDVTDSGPGVPPGVANSLFKIISSGKAKGLGFGLSYCRRVARSAQGDVYHHQNYQGGARFTVLLPFTEVRRKEAEWQCQSTRRR